MTVGSPSYRLDVRRLGGFFEELRALRPSSEADGSIAHLEGLFRQLRPLLAAARPQVEGALELRIPKAESLSRTLEALRTSLVKARRSGALSNVWTTAGLKRDEVRNAGVLASLFNPLEAGDRAVPFLLAFLSEVEGANHTRLPTASELEVGYSVQTEACPLGATDDRVDLSVEGATFLLLIEVKIDAAEGPAQLSRYDEILRRKAQALGKRPALIYLSPQPAREPPPDAFYADWAAVRRAARRVSAARPRADRRFQDHLLAQFAEHVRNF